MEELQTLITMIEKLPALALWVLIGFWAYKVLIVGSIYGLIRFIVAKAHDVLVMRRTKVIDVRPMLDEVSITNALEPLIVEIKRLRGARANGSTLYIHKSGVEFLRDALDAQFVKEAAKQEPRKP